MARGIEIRCGPAIVQVAAAALQVEGANDAGAYGEVVPHDFLR